MKIEVPADHKIGMEVPHGGSNCAKCKYVSSDGKNCANTYFKKWNDGPKLPAPASEYCCDFFEAAGRKTLGDQLRSQKERK